MRYEDEYGKSMGRQRQKEKKLVFGDKPVSEPLCTPQLLRRPARHRIRASETRLWQGTAEVLGGNTSARRKSNTLLTRTGPWWNPGVWGERPVTSRLAHGTILGLAEIWKQTYFSFQHFPISKTELLGLKFPRLYPACPSDNSSTDKTSTGALDEWPGRGNPRQHTLRRN